MPTNSARRRRTGKVPTNARCEACDLIWRAYWKPPFPRTYHRCPRCASHSVVDLWGGVSYPERWRRRGAEEIAQTYQAQVRYGTEERSKLPLAGAGCPSNHAARTALDPDQWLTIAARFPSLCPWCDERIAIGDVVRWRPGEQAQHPECHVNCA